MSFEKLGLSPELLAAVEEQGYKRPTSIQTLAIPKILEGVDVIAGAQTGTGKTAAFTLPLLQKMMLNYQEDAIPHIKTLILAPTRELARQVHENVVTYAKNTPLKSVVLYGGVEYGPQLKKLAAGTDIVVATPGRLMDHLERGNLVLHKINHLVIDEADRMLDMGFIPEVRRLMSQLPRARQTVFFSATFNEDVKALARSMLKNPVSLQAEKANSTASKVTHIVHPVDIQKKRALLSYLIGHNNWQQVLIFTRTKVSADALSKELYLDGIKNMVIHGDRTQANRTKALAHFKEGKIQALVATDIAARGIDIENLPHVINYELPNIPEDYVHRVGRTGRAGQTGNAVTLVTDREVFRLDAVERMIKMNIERKRVPGFEPRNFDPELIARDIKQRKRAKMVGKPRRGSAAKPKLGDWKETNGRPAKPYGNKPYGGKPTSGGGKPFGKKPYGDRAVAASTGKPYGKKPYGDRAVAASTGKPYGKKPFGGKSTKPFGQKPFGDKPGKPFGDKPFGKKTFGDKSGKPFGDKPFGKKTFGDKPGKPFGDKPFGKKTYGDKPGKPFGKKTYGDKPKSFGKKPGGPRSESGKPFDEEKKFAGPARRGKSTPSRRPR